MIRTRHIITVIFSAILISSGPARAQALLEVKVSNNEKWWGLYVGGDEKEPFTSPFTITTDLCGSDYFMTSVLVSNQGRYIWSPSTAEVRFDGKTIIVTPRQGKAELGKGGRTLRDAYLLWCHTNMKPGDKNPPAELFNSPLYDIAPETGIIHDQSMVAGFADGLASSGMPKGTILIPAGWESDSRICEFDKELYPEPQELFNQLHRKGFRVMLTLTPYISASGRVFAESNAKGELLTDFRGEPAVFYDGERYLACLDMSKPSVRDEFLMRIHKLKNTYGIDGFLFSCREVIPHIGRDRSTLTAFMRNWNAIMQPFDMVISASAYNTPPMATINRIGAGKPGWHSIRTAVNNAVVSGLSGYIYPQYSPQLPKDELMLLRTLQLSLFMPVATIPPTAWRMQSGRYAQAFRKTLEMREAMKGEMADLWKSSLATGEPMMRHMEYQFPNQGFSNCDDQFMLGSRYLVAPVLDNSANRTVRLPKGVWTGTDGTQHRGPRVINVDVSDGTFPVFTLNSGKKN